VICVFASLREGEWAKGRMGDFKITNYNLSDRASLRLGEKATWREGEWAKGRMGE